MNKPRRVNEDNLLNDKDMIKTKTSGANITAQPKIVILVS